MHLTHSDRPSFYPVRTISKMIPRVCPLENIFSVSVHQLLEMPRVTPPRPPDNGQTPSRFPRASHPSLTPTLLSASEPGPTVPSRSGRHFAFSPKHVLSPREYSQGTEETHALIPAPHGHPAGRPDSPAPSGQPPVLRQSDLAADMHSILERPCADWDHDPEPRGEQSWCCISHAPWTRTVVKGAPW